MKSDPLWKRSGFWAAIAASVPLLYAAISGEVPQELVVATIGAWAAFFTAAKARPSNANKKVQQVLDAQDRRIAELRRTNGGQYGA